MKKFLKIFLPIILALAIIVSAGWYFLQYDQAFTRDMLLSWARDLDASGNYDLANWIYSLAYRQAGNDDDIAIEIARQYKEHGNYTQAESTLANAISDGGSVALYVELCKTYVEQDKLLDAVKLLDSIPDAGIKAQIDSMRPAAPVPSHESGEYTNDYPEVMFTCPDGKVYANFNNKYPSVNKDLLVKTYTLGDGTTTVQAISVNASGLVSRHCTFQYNVSQISKAITLTDPAVDRVIREMLKVDQDYELMSDDLYTFDYFLVPEDATSLQDLYYMPKLKVLILRDCAVSDISPIGHLKELEELVIDNVILSDDGLQTISTLTTLTSLTASRCSLSTAKPLATLVNLTYLDLNSNAIGDISMLASMPCITTLDMSHNAVSSLDGIEALTMLQVLNVSYNAITTLQPLATCTELRMLEATNNQLTNLKGLEGAVNLGLLYVSSNQLTDISILANNINMADLDVSRNQIKDLSALTGMKNLFMLKFSYNEVKKLPDFSPESILNEIIGDHNQLKSLDQLAGLQMLAKVYMSHNADIKTIDALVSCESLEHIDVLNTAVKDVSAFEGSGVVILYDIRPDTEPETE